MLGARRTGNAMYVAVHEDSERRATTPTGTAVGFQQTLRVLTVPRRPGVLPRDRARPGSRSYIASQAGDLQHAR